MTTKIVTIAKISPVWGQAFPAIHLDRAQPLTVGDVIRVGGRTLVIAKINESGMSDTEDGRRTIARNYSAVEASGEAEDLDHLVVGAKDQADPTYRVLAEGAGQAFSSTRAKAHSAAPIMVG